MVGLGLRALWWRRGASLAVLVAATLAVLAAAIAPLWSGAAQESLVRTRLSGEPVSETGYTTARTAASALSAQPVSPVTAEREVREEAAGLTAGIDGYFDEPRVMLATSEIIVARDEVTARGRLVWHENQCDHLAIDGSCPQARDEVVLTRRSAVALGARRGRPPGPGGRRAEGRSQATRALERMGLSDLSDRLVEQLSGGQRQRVAVARALVTPPSLILADEPTAELDAVNRDRVVAELRAEAERGALVVLATHDPDVAARCDDELHLADGVVVEPA
jgi:ABC-type sugar transport system ATPase subunit